MILVLMVVCFLTLAAPAQYSGGTGEPNDPYQIATAEDLMLLGETPEDYDKHFIVTADIDLDPNLPGRKVFDKAVIALDRDNPFTGVFDGNRHTISHLTITGGSYLGLFGHLHAGAVISSLGLEEVNVNGTGNYVGGLVGLNHGSITKSYCSGSVSGGDGWVGGLVGVNYGSITISYNTCTVGTSQWPHFQGFGGLVGENWGVVTTSYNTGSVTGDERVGGLIGENWGFIATSYSTGSVTGDKFVGGLVGENWLSITNSYSTGAVMGKSNIGGLIGKNYEGYVSTVTTSFWDTQTSDQAFSASGTGLTTREMQDINTFLSAGWDFAYERFNGTCDHWCISPGDYPRLFYHIGNNPEMPEGLGTAREPYLIQDARDLGTVWYEPMAYYRMEASVDMSEITWSMSVVPWFDGTYDGAGRAVNILHIKGGDFLGLFGQLGSGAEICNLGLKEVDVNGVGNSVGALAGENNGSITTSYVTGTISGNDMVGGLVGTNCGSITISQSEGTVRGLYRVGGLVGHNSKDIDSCNSTGSVAGFEDVGGIVGENNEGSITRSHSDSTVSGDHQVGGLVGENLHTSISNCYSTGSVSGDHLVGGLVGGTSNDGSIIKSYSIAAVNGTNWSVGGLVGFNGGRIISSFWNIQASGMVGSDGGVGLTTSEMMNPYMLGLNGFANDPNWILDGGNDYPRLAWEGTRGQIIPEPDINWMEGHGSTENPYRINTSDQLILLGKASILWDKEFILGTDIDLDSNLPNGQIFGQAIIPEFSGVFDGKDHLIYNLVITGYSHLGVFGQLRNGAVVRNIGIVDANIIGSGDSVGALVGENWGFITNSYSTGSVTGDEYVGGLAGENWDASISNCRSTGPVTGSWYVGGLVGQNCLASISNCYSTGSVTGWWHVGGLVGANKYDRISTTISKCHNTGSVTGSWYVGGLVGDNREGSISSSYSTGTVSGGGLYVGGLVGINYGGNVTTSYSNGDVNGGVYVGGLVGLNSLRESSVFESYSSGMVTGHKSVGGLLGKNSQGSVMTSFWDIQTSGHATSDGGTGITTAEMQMASTFLEPGWDFVGETENGTEDIWWILEGQDYPRLWWELGDATP